MLLEQLQELIARGISISQTDIVTAIKMAKRGTLDYFLNLYMRNWSNFSGKPIRAKTFGQQQYIHAIKKTDMVFGNWACRNWKNFF